LQFEALLVVGSGLVLSTKPKGNSLYVIAFPDAYVSFVGSHSLKGIFPGSMGGVGPGVGELNTCAGM
jgi:hypothetical protein